jgi:hypothetical protein
MGSPDATESRYDIDYSTRGAVADIGATFAGVLLVVSGAMDVLQGMSAVANDDLYAAGSDYLYRLDMTAWGWVHIGLGAIGVVIGVAVVMRASWGQVLGMIVAGLTILTNFAFLPHYPLWSLVVIAFNGFVIWALSVQLQGYRH